MNELTPSEIIKFRAECFKVTDGGGVYSLYALNSDMRRLFNQEDFAQHFRLLIQDCEHVGLNVVSEEIKGNLAVVKYIEHISEKGELTTYYSKTFFVKENSSWKIVNEKREKHQ